MHFTVSTCHTASPDLQCIKNYSYTIIKEKYSTQEYAFYARILYYFKIQSVTDNSGKSQKSKAFDTKIPHTYQNTGNDPIV